MGLFKFQQSTSGQELTLELSGRIEEGARFPVVEDPSVKKIVFDLKGLEYINSLGIRDWVSWIEPLSEKYQLSMRNCPKRLVHQFNMVNGFLPKGTQVTSLFVPYFCEKCDFEESFLYHVGKEIKLEAGIVTLKVDMSKFKDCKDSDCGLELDGSESKYFQFLKQL